MSPARCHWPAPPGRMVAVDGLALHVIEQGEGDPILFLHGGGPGCHGWSDFGPVVPLFALDHRCILVDLVQYGKSDKRPIVEPVWSFHARYLDGLLDALEVARTDVVCSSWGGSAGLCLAADHPDRVGALVITGAMPVRHGALAPLPEGLAGTGPGRGKTARDEYYGGDGPSLEKMRALMARFEWFDETRIPDATVSARYEQSVTTEEHRLYTDGVARGAPQDLSAAMAAIEAPVLFMWGMHDAFLTPDYPLMLANLVKQGHLHVMARAAHHLEEERPEAYAGAVRAFLSSEGIAREVLR